MESGYSARLSPNGEQMVFWHPVKEPFTLPTSPHLTLGDAWATLAHRVDIALFLEHWVAGEAF